MKYSIFLILIVVVFLSLIIGSGGMDKEIICRIRFPRVLLGIFAGGILSLVGGVLQGLLQNPLCDPYILGIASGAAFGVAFAFLLGRFSYFLLPVFAFLFSLGAMLLVYLIAQISGRIQKLSLILAGVLVSFLFSSLSILIMVLSKKSLSAIIYLVMGNLSVVFTPFTLRIFLFVFLFSLFLSLFLLSYARELDIISTGEEAAKSLGIETEKLTKIIFFLSSLLVALVVSYCGSVSFVGLVVPHLARSLFGFNHRSLLPASFLLGGCLLLGADLLARTVSPVELPLSVVTALFGVPFFLYLLRRV
uniref:Iron ABC transporter permease n=1 Tax=candidate division WOR-3 bacterium TaxID=2052148 RepID=A0A7C3UNW2_UNCW3